MTGFETTQAIVAGLQGIVAAGAAVTTIANTAQQLLTRHAQGNLTDQQLAAEWLEMQGRMREALARWRAAGVPPVAAAPASTAAIGS